MEDLILEAALALSQCEPSLEVISAARELSILISESLRHPRHAKILVPLQKKLRVLFVRRFKRQEKAFLAESWLSTMTVKEAVDPKALQISVTQKIDSSEVFNDDLDSDAIAFERLVKKAAAGAQQNVAADLDIEIAKQQGIDFVDDYLKQNAFEKLSKEVDATSKERLSNALTEVLERDGTYTEAVHAIRDTFAEFTESRAETIAKTELNDAYNAAILNSGRQIGGSKKAWNLDGEGCPICEDNAADGEIDIDEDFSSGDDAPTAHPNCDCSLSIISGDE